MPAVVRRRHVDPDAPALPGMAHGTAPRTPAPAPRTPAPAPATPPPAPGLAAGASPLAPAPGRPAPEVPAFRVDVVRSARRRRTVGAHLLGGVLTVTVPAWMSADDTEQWVATMSRRFARRLTTDRIDLARRAEALARRHRLPRPRTIRWADDMQSRWGSCTPTTKTVRISSRVAAFPDWVVDYVIVHELAHLEVADHSPAFWALVERYPRAERARGYLIAKSGDADDA